MPNDTTPARTKRRSGRSTRETLPLTNSTDLPKSERKQARESDIPGLELGEPEEAVPEGAAKSAVLVAPEEGMEIGHGEGEEGLVGEELEKHRRFQAMRKRHYEMKDVKGLLG